MRLLVLGGTVFLSRAVAVEAMGRGHDVTCASRGESGSVPAGAAFVAWDRSDGAEPPAELARASYDAVVDVARHPSRVRAAVAAFPEAHWVFVSTINVYTDTSTPNGNPETLSLHDPIVTDEEPASASEVYGAMKVGCEQAVTEGAASSIVVRPGLIVGPGDPTGRFTSWAARIADGGEVLAPGEPNDAVQVVDVRDLATWLVDCAEARTTGVFDGIGPVQTRAELLAGLAAGIGAEPTFVWVNQDFLIDQKVEPWAGDRSAPLWLPLPEYAGVMAHDATLPADAGLACRPVEDTARDTLAWLREHPDAKVTGMSRAEEAELLAAFSRTGPPP